MKIKHLLLTALIALIGGGNSFAAPQASELTEGDFYLYNVSTGKYLCSGNDWGSHATITPYGMPLTLAKVSDGVYTISTGYYYTDKYLDGEWLDGGAMQWTFENAGENVYYITNGENYLRSSESEGARVVSNNSSVDNGCKWQLVTRDQRIEEMSHATKDNPIDVTFLIKNPYFVKGNGQTTTGKDKNPIGWSGTTATDYWGVDSPNSAEANFCVEMFNKTFDIYQELAGLPKGFYGISAQGYQRGSQVAYLYINDSKQLLKDINDGETVPDGIGTAATAFLNNRYNIDAVYTYNSTGALRVGINKPSNTANDWCAFDNFVLTYYPINVNDEISQLASDTWSNQNGNVGWAMHDSRLSGAPERYETGAFTGDVMTQEIKGLPKGTYEVKLYGAASYTPGRGFEGATGQNRAYFFANDALQSLEVYERTEIQNGEIDEAVLTCGVTEDGILRLGIENKTIGANWFVIKLVSITYKSTDLPTTDVTLTTKGNGKFTTFIAPFNAELPSGVTAYTITNIENGVLTLEVQSSLTANTPVVITSESAVTETISGISEAVAATYTTGLLTGVYAPVEITEGYVLQTLNNKQAFYKVDADHAITIPANKAYLTIPVSESNAKPAYFFDEATSTNEVQSIINKEIKSIYAPNGMEVKALQKGMNIVEMTNGEITKVLVK